MMTQPLWRSAVGIPLQTAAVATGDGSAAEVIKPGQGAYKTALFLVTGITTATITWEGSPDGTNWVGLMAAPTSTGVAAATATTNNCFRADVSGFVKVRARISAWTEGAVTVKVNLIA